MADSVSYYRLQIASDTTFSSLQVNDSVPASTVAGPMTHDAGPFAQGTTYAWRVIAVKGGSQRASAARWFTTGSIVIPVDGDPEPLP